MMSKLNYINVNYKKNYAIVNLKIENDCWTEELLFEIKNICQIIQDNKKCLAVLFMSDSNNSGSGWSQSLSSMSDAVTIINETIIAVEELTIPSFFLIQGKANLPAMEMALACDIRFSLEDIKISLIDQESNLQPSDFIIEKLAKFSHRSFALDLLLFQKSLNAIDAKKSGLISEIYNAKNVLSELEAVLEKITNYGSVALRVIKESMLLGGKIDLSAGFNIEHERTLQLQETQDFQEGVNAFLEKRSPKFQGK